MSEEGVKVEAEVLTGQVVENLKRVIPENVVAWTVGHRHWPETRAVILDNWERFANHSFPLDKHVSAADSVELLEEVIARASDNPTALSTIMRQMRLEIQSSRTLPAYLDPKTAQLTLDRYEEKRTKGLIEGRPAFLDGQHAITALEAAYRYDLDQTGKNGWISSSTREMIRRHGPPNYLGQAAHAIAELNTYLDLESRAHQE